MRLISDQTIIPCKEHETLQLSVRELLDKDGNLSIYPDVLGKGYFDIDFRGGRLVLRSTRYIGLIPISDRIAIHVEPKVPIGNLFNMISRAGVQVSALPGFVRGYAESRDPAVSPEDFYLDTFISALRPTRTAGPLKQYTSYETSKELRGRLLAASTISRYRSRGICNVHSFEVHNQTLDNVANRIIKHTAERLLKHITARPYGNKRDIAREIARLLDAFSSVNSALVNPSIVARNTINVIRGLPASHRFYEPALWLSYLIATESGVKMESVGRPRFETLIIDVADVFEHYVRELCRDSAVHHFGGCRVVDGNLKPIQLFLQGGTFPSHPDVYFLRQGAACAVVDAKYKPKLSAEDRYELIGFCEALNVTRAAFVCPRFSEASNTVHVGTTSTGKQIYIAFIDLSAADMEIEELRFTQELGQTLGLN